MTADLTRTPLELMLEIEEMRTEMRSLTNSLHETNLALAKVAAERDLLLELVRLHQARIARITATRRRLAELGVEL